MLKKNVDSIIPTKKIDPMQRKIVKGNNTQIPTNIKYSKKIQFASEIVNQININCIATIKTITIIEKLKKDFIDEWINLNQFTPRYTSIYGIYVLSIYV